MLYAQSQGSKGAEALEEIGFEIIQVKNTARREMNRQQLLFASRLEVGDEALFFYAGHGVEIAGQNFLLVRSPSKNRCKQPKS